MANEDASKAVANAMKDNEPVSQDILLANKVKESPMVRNGIFDPNQQRNDQPVARDVLWEHWTTATREFVDKTSTNNNTHLSDWFERLYSMHGQEGRYYHTAVHLQEMLEYYELLMRNGYTPKLDSQDKQAIVLSIFFHDAIYNAQSITNEEDSAKLFETFVQDVESVPTTLQQRVVDYILATKQHEASSPDPAQQLFLDLDMAVLGKDPIAYRQYAGLIRQEYSHVPHDTYCEKRADVLESFLEHPLIYSTSVLRLALEERARENLREEIQLLRKGTIPGQ